MYKETRALSRTEAVESIYQDMAARHRSRFRSIHVRPPSTLRRTRVANCQLTPVPDPPRH
jgi:large subunit ribosomal protein L18Ae